MLSMHSLLVYLTVFSASAFASSLSLVRRPHGIQSLSDYSCLFTALDHYGQSCQRNGGCHEDFETLWHQLSKRTFVNQRTGTLTALRYGEHDESMLFSSNDENMDFTILSLDFISPAVCAAKVQVSVGMTRYTNMIGLLKTATTTASSDQLPPQEQSYAWKIVHELSSSMDMTNIPSGCLLPPLTDTDAINSNCRFGPPEDDEVSDIPLNTHSHPLSHTPIPFATTRSSWEGSVKRLQLTFKAIICQT